MAQQISPYDPLNPLAQKLSYNKQECEDQSVLLYNAATDNATTSTISFSNLLEFQSKPTGPDGLIVEYNPSTNYCVTSTAPTLPKIAIAWVGQDLTAAPTYSSTPGAYTAVSKYWITGLLNSSSLYQLNASCFSICSGYSGGTDSGSYGITINASGTYHISGSASFNNSSNSSGIYCIIYIGSARGQQFSPLLQTLYSSNVLWAGGVANATQYDSDMTINFDFNATISSGNTICPYIFCQGTNSGSATLYGGITATDVQTSTTNTFKPYNKYPWNMCVELIALS